MKFIKNEKTNCWEWVAGRNYNGYGEFSFLGKRCRAHRVSYILYKGSIKKNKIVCHKCDNPCCVNPDHLFLGTPKDNTKDMMNKGRLKVCRGENHCRAKLNTNQIIEIRKFLQEGKLLQREIAEFYNVTRHNISSIKLNKIWKHLL